MHPKILSSHPMSAKSTLDCKPTPKINTQLPTRNTCSNPRESSNTSASTSGNLRGMYPLDSHSPHHKVNPMKNPQNLTTSLSSPTDFPCPRANALSLHLRYPVLHMRQAYLAIALPAPEISTAESCSQQMLYICMYVCMYEPGTPDPVPLWPGKCFVACSGV
jgi:hypothetical protein